MATQCTTGRVALDCATPCRPAGVVPAAASALPSAVIRTDPVLKVVRSPFSLLATFFDHFGKFEPESVVRERYLDKGNSKYFRLMCSGFGFRLKA